MAVGCWRELSIKHAIICDVTQALQFNLRKRIVKEPNMITIWKYSGSNQVDSSSSTLPPNSVSNLSTQIYIVQSSFNSSSLVLLKKKLENLPPLLCCPSNRAALEFNNHFISRNSRSVPAIQEAKCPLFCLRKTVWEDGKRTTLPTFLSRNLFA